MRKFIEKPNLPQGAVSLVISGDMPLFLKNFLESRNIKILTCKNNEFIDSAVKSHADMSAVHIGMDKIIVDKQQQKLIHTLKDEGFNVINSADIISGEYPDDIKLNVALFGNNAIGAFRYSDSNLMLQIESFRKYNVKQGYAKCSVLPLSENALITDDESIYKALKNTADILLVSKGDITLIGHDYGFIGGASCKISRDEILFFGDLRAHRNSAEILSFFDKYNHKAIFFENQPLYDIGGLVTLCEI